MLEPVSTNSSKNVKYIVFIAIEDSIYRDFFTGSVLDKDGFCYSFSDELARRPGFTKINLVCVYPDGRAPSRHMITSKLHAQGINSHSFRHTQATKLISAGIQPMTAARRLGHSKPGTTINVYTHDSETLQKSAVSILDQQERRAF